MNTQEFILQHRLDDVRNLALLSGRFPDVDMPFALDQIAGWQTARTKLPSWAENDGVVYPPHLSMEQCSSELTARYKASLVRGSSLVDLTGGFGVDFSFMASQCEHGVYVERQEHLCQIARNNFDKLGLNHVGVICGEAETFLDGLEHSDTIYLDPARRDDNGAKTYAIEDCTPNLILLSSRLLDKAERVVAKLSPMLDWHRALELLPDVKEVHIVSVQNECKELVLVLEKSDAKPCVFCVNIIDAPLACADALCFDSDDVPIRFIGDAMLTDRILCVPNASIMKSGLFGRLCSSQHVASIGPNSNLFIALEDCDETQFPGRTFHIQNITTMNKGELRKALSGLSRANIAVRNFPLSVADLRKRLKLKDGGDTYIFGTTTQQGQHVLLICNKC